MVMVMAAGKNAVSLRAFDAAVGATICGPLE
jgi:hypothetical protein